MKLSPKLNQPDLYNIRSNYGWRGWIFLFEDNPNPGDISLIEEMREVLKDFSYELKSVETLNEGLSLLKEHPFE